MELTPSETRASFLQASTTVILVLLIRNHSEPLLSFSNSTRKEAPSLLCKWRMSMVPMPKTRTTWPMLKR